MAEITNARIEQLRLRIDQLETQLRMPLPTPEIGRWVWFYRQADLATRPIPALVTEQDGPGQVSLMCFPKNSREQFNISGVHHKDHPFVAANEAVVKMKNGGVWDYRDGDKPTQAHRELHAAAIKRQIDEFKKELLHERELEIRRRDREQEIEQLRGKAPVAASA